MGFYSKMEEETTKKLTLNNSPTYSSSLNKNLDFFALGGSVRNWDDSKVCRLFMDAYREDKELAFRNLVYLRDIRGGGKGERKTFRTILVHLSNYPEMEGVVKRLVSYIPALGRWDDVIHLFAYTNNKEIKTHIATSLAAQLVTDAKNMSNNKEVTLLAKWLPSINTSSKQTKAIAKELITFMFGRRTAKEERIYRKTLSGLRSYLDVVEVKMSNRQWKEIKYPELPSLAALKYRKAFMRNDVSRYTEYIKQLNTGKTKINASVTYPYQIVQAYGNLWNSNPVVDPILESAWKSLPDYIGNSDDRIIVVADTSGSMYGTPMEVSISLAIYCAQRLQGEFHGKYISFSSSPSLNTVYSDSTLIENIQKVAATEWGTSTDINKVFSLILDTAIRHNMTQEELPNKVLIISDMEFDMAQGSDTWWSGSGSSKWTETNYQHVKRLFNSHGYTLPQVVFWNVNALSSTIPARKDELGVAMVSGLTPSIFKSVLNGDVLHPEKTMLNTLNVSKYDFVKDIIKG